MVFEQRRNRNQALRLLAFLIFTDDLRLRLLDYPDWYLLTHAKKRNLVATRAFVLARMRAARQ